eukprot:scaffold10408_cov26-Tisochrysis_lutea.AAC.1
MRVPGRRPLACIAPSASWKSVSSKPCALPTAASETGLRTAERTPRTLASCRAAYAPVYRLPPESLAWTSVPRRGSMMRERTEESISSASRRRYSSVISSPPTLCRPSEAARAASNASTALSMCGRSTLSSAGSSATLRRPPARESSSHTSACSRRGVRYSLPFVVKRTSRREEE